MMGPGSATSLLLLLLLLLPRLLSALQVDFRRRDFPSDFVFGAGTSAVQYEGATAEDGRTPSVMDPEGKIGDEESDGYHKYKEDAKLMSDTGLDAYRFSISWSRILPYGRGTVNPKGVEYYNSVLHEITKRGIQPHVTLNHLDLPKVLEDEYGGWESPKIVDDFKEFANVCFSSFGDRVTRWTTMNEPNVHGMLYWRSCGNSTYTPTYNMVHNMLVSHSEVVRLYRTKYQKHQGGLIGLNSYSFWCQPFSNSSADVEATERAKNFMFGWLMNPLIFGDYPETMRKIAKSRLPSFTKSQAEVLKGSFDFIGLNYYTAAYVSDISNGSGNIHCFKADIAVDFRVERNDRPARGPFTIYRVPSDFSGLQKMIEYLMKTYGSHLFFIHENGFAADVNAGLSDTARIEYLKGYIRSMLEAIRSGAQIRGYFVWSFIDLFEFIGGYNTRFGLYHVDFDAEDRPRTPRLSAKWYSTFLKNNSTVMSPNIQRDHDLEDLPYSSQ
ncbi:Beta-glucosidase 22 [Apostasia shenzhenica]|uniref:Beta-glucosidase 22 n=1 Tax=Apostasia shenzhenica TaxID=1088818 RepID=A0A2I0A618_9ASPA|nr:Beta-glucosidase 22 [Apostasia shenzhenica]